LRDLANIAHKMEGKKAALRVLEQSVDTATSAGKAFFGMLAVFAQFETMSAVSAKPRELLGSSPIPSCAGRNIRAVSRVLIAAAL
jgi:hypothetical protein